MARRRGTRHRAPRTPRLSPPVAYTAPAAATAAPRRRLRARCGSWAWPAFERSLLRGPSEPERETDVSVVVGRAIAHRQATCPTSPTSGLMEPFVHDPTPRDAEGLRDGRDG
jgi:hypothetical protein